MLKLCFSSPHVRPGSVQIAITQTLLVFSRKSTQLHSAQINATKNIGIHAYRDIRPGLGKDRFVPDP